jgi:hypothetical protein
MYKRERKGMAASAVIRRNLEDRAFNLQEAFDQLMQTSREINRQLVHRDLLAPTDSRVTRWILQMRQRLNECRQWIADVHRDSTRHNYNGQEDQFATIEQAMHDAEFVDQSFFADSTPSRDLEGLWDDWVECAENLAVELFVWAEHEKYNPMVNPLRHKRYPPAGQPPVPWSNEDEDVNPPENLARTGNPYFIM